MEGSGARVVPILDTETDDETLYKLLRLNGVLFPGGAGDDQYKAKAEYIYRQAIDFNDSDTYFPLFGICQGFEYLNIFASDAGDQVLSQLESHHVSISLDFKVDPATTKMFKAAGEDAKLYQTADSSF